MIKSFKLPVRFACLVGCFLLPCYGSLVTYSNLATFNAGVPGLLTETFASGLVNPAHVTTCNGPLSNTQGNTCFPNGGLLPGIIYSATSSQMAVIGQSFPGLNNTTNLLSPNLSGDVFDLAFMQANAVGFNLFPGPASPGNVVVSIYNPANALLGTFSVFSPLNGAFFGILSSTDLIGHIDLLSQAANFPNATITNLSFGVAPTAAVPEPCSWLLVSAGLVSLVRLRRPRCGLHH